jgi:hypothetical protein
MQRDAAVSLLSRHFPKWVKILRRSHGEFMNLPADYRVTLDSTTRANHVQNRVIYHLLMTFGETGAVRLKSCALYPRLKYLLVEGAGQSAGVRFKKLERTGLRSSNVPTETQLALREERAFLFEDADPAHLICGYTETDDEINPSIERVVLTSENLDGLDWWHLLWMAPVAAPIPIETGYEQLPLESTVKVRAKRGGAGGAGRGDGAWKQGG